MICRRDFLAAGLLLTPLAGLLAACGKTAGWPEDTFAANDGVVGNELWRTDGTPAGTTLVQDFNVGNAGANGNPRQLMVAGNRMFLVATTASTGNAVFTIDPGGTPQPTTVTGGVAGSPVLCSCTWYDRNSWTAASASGWAE